MRAVVILYKFSNSVAFCTLFMGLSFSSLPRSTLYIVPLKAIHSEP